MTSFALAWRTAKRYRARTLLAIAGVAVIGALLFDMLLLSRGLLLSFADLLNSSGFDIRVMSSDAPAARLPIADSARLADDIRRLPDVERVLLIRIEPATVRATSRPPQGISLIGSSDAEQSWRIVKGSALDSPAAAAEACPVLVTRPLAAAFGLTPGDSLSINVRPPGVASALPAVTCRVFGIADFAFATNDELTAVTTMEAFRQAMGGGQADADLVLVSSKPDAPPGRALRAIAGLRTDLRAYSNEDVVAQFNRNGFAYFRQISLVLSSLTMVFAFLLVATLLTVSINQRLGEIAALRALGIGRPRIASMLLWESALLVGGGGLLALPLGQLLALVLDRILRQMPGIPERMHFFVFEPRALAIHLALLTFTAVAAAVYPVWLTARLPIADTLRREVLG
ncbi:MAG TPA: FtsX-like permease family protein [Vicinamibacterales bacterium]|jgi:putative ABC transport system permease protein|nr:FtsX-like permease family protein [Vicinamibacterales bacterium]